MKRKKRTLICGANVINENQNQPLDLLIEGDFIASIGKHLESIPVDLKIDATGQYLMPGLIDDQVHFREPGLTHKGEIYTESMAAVSGGVTSFMEMPNTKPPTLTLEAIEKKVAIAKKKSLANFAFHLGSSKDNINEIAKIDPTKICGVKAFLASSTGNMLIQDEKTLHKLFKTCPTILSAHCEHEPTIQANLKKYQQKYKN